VCSLRALSVMYRARSPRREYAMKRRRLGRCWDARHTFFIRLFTKTGNDSVISDCSMDCSRQILWMYCTSTHRRLETLRKPIRLAKMVVDLQLLQAAESRSWRQPTRVPPYRITLSSLILLIAHKQIEFRRYRVFCDTSWRVGIDLSRRQTSIELTDG
jgi:hypothetical protein